MDSTMNLNEVRAFVNRHDMTLVSMTDVLIDGEGWQANRFTRMGATNADRAEQELNAWEEFRGDKLKKVRFVMFDHVEGENKLVDFDCVDLHIKTPEFYQLDTQRQHDILSYQIESAFEYSWGWIKVCEYDRVREWVSANDPEWVASAEYVDHLPGDYYVRYLAADAKHYISIALDDTREPCKLTYKRLMEGMNQLQQERSDLYELSIEEQGDADSADIFIQYALFNEYVYA